MIFRKTLHILLTLLVYRIGAFTTLPPVADTLLLPSVHHPTDLYSEDVNMLTTVLQYYCRPVAFTVCSDGSETISGVRWLIDGSLDARSYMYGMMTQKPDTGSILLDNGELARMPSESMHTLTARITVAEGGSTDIVWRFMMVPTEFFLFTATVRIEDAVDTLQGDSIFTLSFGDASGLDTAIFSTEYDNCGNMAGVGGFRFDAVGSVPTLTDTLQLHAFSETYEYARNNRYQYLLPFLDKKNAQPLCQILYMESRQKRFACIPVPFSTVADKPPLTLEQAYQDYYAASPLKLRIDPIIVREVRKRIITCPTVVTNQDAFRLISWYDEEHWYFEENKKRFEMISNSSYSYTQQFKIDGSGEAVTVSCNESCYAPEGLTCVNNGYCPAASASPGQTAAQSGGIPYRVISSQAKGVINVFYRTDEKPAGISVYSLTGRLCCNTASIGESSTMIGFAGYPSGLYVVAVKGSGKCGGGEYRFIVPVAAH